MQREHLRMRLAGALVPALANDFAFLDQHTADAGVRVCRIQPSRGELQRAAHMKLILGSVFGRHFFLVSSRRGPPGNSGSWSWFGSRRLRW